MAAQEHKSRPMLSIGFEVGPVMQTYVLMVTFPNVSMSSMLMLVQDTGICSSALSLQISATVFIINSSPTTRCFGSGCRTPLASRMRNHDSTPCRAASCAVVCGSDPGGVEAAAAAAPAASTSTVLLFSAPPPSAVSGAAVPAASAAASSVSDAVDTSVAFVMRRRTRGDEAKADCGVPSPAAAVGGAGNFLGVEPRCLGLPSAPTDNGVIGVPGALLAPAAAFVCWPGEAAGLALFEAPPGGTGNFRGDFPLGGIEKKVFIFFGNIQKYFFRALAISHFFFQSSSFGVAAAGGASSFTLSVMAGSGDASGVTTSVMVPGV